MKNVWSLLLFTLLVVVLAVTANAQQLENRHMLELQLGAWNHNQDQGVTTEFGDGGAQFDVNGLTSGLSYGYFVSEAVSINFSVGMRSASVDALWKGSQSHLESASVVHLSCGIKYFLPHSTSGSIFRPYLMGEIGPVIGSQTSMAGWINSEWRTETQTALGARFGGGANFLLGPHLMSGVSLGYYLMSNFDVPVGGYRNYNGSVLSFSLGYLFGGSSHPQENIN